MIDPKVAPVPAEPPQANMPVFRGDDLVKQEIDRLLNSEASPYAFSAPSVVAAAGAPAVSPSMSRHDR
jgi:hypothetical protein